MVEKAVNREVKVNLQPSSRTREIDSRCPKHHSPSAKKDKDDANWEYWDRNKNKNKAKSHNLFSTNSQPQTQVSKKDKYQRNRQRGHLVIGVNATKIVKKDKDKAKDLSHIKYYTCKQKDHYANKCAKNPKY